MIRCTLSGDRRGLAIAGEFDAAGRARFERAVEELDLDHTVVVDLSATTFIDSGGLECLVRLRQAAADRRTAVRRTQVPRNILRMLVITDVGRQFDVRS